MKLVNRNLLVLALVLLLALPATQLLAQSEGSLDSEDNRILYALGLAMGQNLAQFGLTAEEFTLVKQGLSDVVMGKEAQVDLMAYGPKVQAFAQGRMKAAQETMMAEAKVKAAGERAEGEKFLAKMAAEEGAVRTESGLIYKEISAGTGANPKATDKVKVHYHGTLRDGKVFDSSVQKGNPLEIGLNQVVGCWTEGIQMVKVGGKARLVCPADIAYGDQGRPGIPGGAVLVFEVELLEILTAAE